MKKITKVIALALTLSLGLIAFNGCTQSIQDEFVEQDYEVQQEEEREFEFPVEISKYHRGGLGGRGGSHTTPSL